MLCDCGDMTCHCYCPCSHFCILPFFFLIRVLSQLNRLFHTHTTQPYTPPLSSTLPVNTDRTITGVLLFFIRRLLCRLTLHSSEREGRIETTVIMYLIKIVTVRVGEKPEKKREVSFRERLNHILCSVMRD